MSDVVVSVVESTTSVTVSEQDVAVAVTESTVAVSAATVGLQGIQGIGYTGVTSTSTITIGSGLKTFTLVSANQGAFLTGMRIRAIHSDTPTYYLEGTANYVGAGTLILTVDKFNGSGSHNSWLFAIAGEIGQTGATGASGVISVTSPITNSGSASSAIVGIDQTLLSLTRSQISDFTSGTVTSASTAQQAGTAVYATTSGTAIYSTTSGTALTISGTITNSQISDFGSGTVANISGTVTQAQVSGLSSTLAGYAALGSANAFTVGGQVINNAATAVVPLAIRAIAGQSANLQEWQNSGGTALVNVSSAGQLNALQGLNTTTIRGTDSLTAILVSNGRGITIGTNSAIQGGGTAVIGIANASTIPTSSPTGGGILYVNTGALTYRGTSNAGQQIVGADGSIKFVSPGTAVVGAIIQGAAGQSANLQEWQDSSAGTAALITSAGRGAFPRISAGAATDLGYGTLSVLANNTATVPIVARAVTGQSANLQEWQNSGGTAIASVGSAGNFVFANTSNAIASNQFILGTRNSGGELTLVRQTAATTNPGANLARLYFRDGTNTGTLKLVVRAGAAGAETTILDNIPQ